MARYKHYDYNQTRMIPLRFADQIQPGSFEYTLNHVVDNDLDLSVFAEKRGQAPFFQSDRKAARTQLHEQNEGQD